jgi:hypothetical protein
MVACPACGAAHDGRGSTSHEQTGPEPDAPWRARCWECGWSTVEHYLEDAQGEADDHQCPRCSNCGHHDPAPNPDHGPVVEVESATP